MSNVKTGDFAKLVGVEDIELASNIGCHVFIVGQYTGAVKRPENGPYWACEILQTAKTMVGGKIFLKYPGTLLHCADRYLRRIDPPKEDADSEKKDKEIRVD